MSLWGHILSTFAKIVRTSGTQMTDFMKAPCQHCPFRRDVRPFLTTERAEDLAYNAENRYGSFPCHKTTESDDNSEDGEMMVVETTKECAGHLSMKYWANVETFYDEDGFKPSDLCYSDSWEMIDAYETENETRK